MTPSICSTCGAQILPGTGHYSTPSGLYCLRCGVKLPIPSGVRVNITITDPDGRLNRSGNKEASRGK